jgi:hypothetical protein
MENESEVNAGEGKRRINTNFGGRCRVCAKTIESGSLVWYNKAASGSKIWHLECDGKPAAGDLLQKMAEKVAPVAALGDEDKGLVLRLIGRMDQIEGKFRGAEAGFATREAEVREILHEVTAIRQTYQAMLEASKREVVIRLEDYDAVEVGLQHQCFPQLLRAASARMADGGRLSVWLSGPAGSGKTTAARNVAKALSLPFYFTGSIDTEYKLLGFTNASGQVVSRPFRTAWEKGGIFLMDEIDGSLPPAVLALNAALANGICDFPDGAIERHPDCVVIAAANTWGAGATSEYVGRMRLDAASLDRFIQMEWPIDEVLETATAPNKEWCFKVQSYRRKVASRGLKHMITPRATYYGAALLAAGMDEDAVLAMTIRKGLSEDQWKGLQ